MVNSCVYNNYYRKKQVPQACYRKCSLPSLRPEENRSENRWYDMCECSEIPNFDEHYETFKVVMDSFISSDDFTSM